jgi:N-acetylmuramoyl-L-alanine amidase
MGQRKRIALVPGHTIESPGAEGVPPIGKHERYWAVDFAQALSTILSPKFEVTIFFRDGKTILETYEIVEKWGPAASLELHFNAEPSGVAQGTLTVVNPKWEAFGVEIQKAMVTSLLRVGMKDRGVEVILPGDQDTRGWANVKNLDFPNAILEPFFGSNVGDCRLFIDRQQALCESLRDALLSQIYTVQEP